jgi:transcriptional regulator with XRE-family HTH domain
MKRGAARIDTMRFFTRLRQLGYRSQNAVADAAGLTRSSLSRYLRGEVKMPMEAVLAIAKVLLCSTKWFIVRLSSFLWQSVKEMHDTPSKYPSVE